MTTSRFFKATILAVAATAALAIAPTPGSAHPIGPIGPGPHWGGHHGGHRSDWRGWGYYGPAAYVCPGFWRYGYCVRPYYPAW